MTARAVEGEPQGGYDTITLQNPIFSEEEVVTQTEQVTTWLNENYSDLNRNQLKNVREHLYYLIDSRIKTLYSRSSVILPTEPDPILESLFAWAEPLGVYGGNLAYNAVNAADSVDRPARLTKPETIALNMEDDLLTVSSSEHGWQFEIPYYFMMTELGEFNLRGNLPVQSAMLSTGASQDETELGHSQGTLIFMFSPESDAATLGSTVREAFGISDRAQEKTLEEVSQISYYEQDTEQGLNLHKEITTWENESGAYSVVFVGAEGTYQWNRPHFIDFVSSLKDS
ncbi:MAG: hypothetical protein AAFQ63_15275 [Cyanobacteria bacterium J06621_11]